MICAYDKIYLENARNNLGIMLDYAVNVLEYELDTFWDIFLSSDISCRFSAGDASVLVGRSGVELALEVLGISGDYKAYVYPEFRTEEYWTGWALAYYQWITCLTFEQITDLIKIDEIRMLYSPYHEMDIRQFCDKVYDVYFERKPCTNLKSRRLLSGLSQSQLAKLTDIPVRTIQQYEQGQKDINKASFEYIISLSNILCCDPKLLMEVRKNW